MNVGDRVKYQGEPVWIKRFEIIEDHRVRALVERADGSQRYVAVRYLEEFPKERQR